MSQIFSKVWLCFWMGLAVLVGAAAVITPGYAPTFQLSNTLAAPSIGHWGGFDAFGQDVLKLALFSSAQTFLLAGIATVTACLLGIFFGTSIALAPSRIRFMGLRTLEFLLAFPSLILALSIAAVQGPGWGTLLVSLLVGIVPSFARLVLVRAEEILKEPFIEAAHGLGADRRRIVLKHLLPHLRGVISVKIPSLFVYALLGEATLSFLGVGAPIGRPTWGSCLAQARDYLIEAPHLMIAFGLPLFLTIFSLQTLSEALAEKQ